MGAVVEDDEGAKQEARRRKCEGKGDPDRDLEAGVHGHGEDEVGHDRGRQIEQAVANGGSLVASDRLTPVETVGRSIGIGWTGSRESCLAHDPRIAIPGSIAAKVVEAVTPASSSISAKLA